MPVLVAPSLLSADLSKLSQEIAMLNASQADLIHIDVMDGVFVPNITFGFPVIKALKKHAEKPLDVHLMITEPYRYLQEFRDAGADILHVHFEACTHLHRTLTAIKSLGMKAGIVLNPHTPVHFLENSISEADIVLLMSVNPGFGGQQFIAGTYEKISLLKELILRKKTSTAIEIDGGVSTENAEKLVAAGANILVAGNSIFSAESPTAAIQMMKGY
jgi:ribulose-phosphate 3-epimerase